MGGLTKEEIAQIQAVCRAVYPRSKEKFEPSDAVHIARLFGASIDIGMMGACVTFDQLVRMIERVHPDPGLRDFTDEMKKFYNAMGGLNKQRLTATDLGKFFMHSRDNVEGSMVNAMVECIDTSLEETDFDLEDLTAFLGKGSRNRMHSRRGYS